MNTPNDADRVIYTVPTRPAARSELLAIREWRVGTDAANDRAILTSLNGEQVWNGPVFHSPWSPGEADGPSSGVHAFKHGSRGYFLKNGWFFGYKTWVWGWVALSGMVEESEVGYRAERAAIRQLRLGPRTLACFDSADAARIAIDDLEDRYQCRVKVGYQEWRVSRTMIALRSR